MNQISGSPVPRDAAKLFWNDHCTYLPAMLGWFLFSATLSSYNKFVFGQGHMAFPCPLFLTSMHFLIQWIFSFSACACFPVQLGSKRLDILTWKEWAMVSAPCGLVTALDVGFSNLSLVRITLTFYTMVKSSTPVFVLGWAYLFKIERITWHLIGVIVIIAAGEFLTVYGEVEFDSYGFFLCLTASVLSGLRWTLVQSLLQKLDPPIESTIVTMKLVSPFMFGGMFFLSIIFEKPWEKLVGSGESEYSELWSTFWLGAFGGVIAIMMILCEFYLILKSSAMILMIGGVIKELTTIAIGVSFFGDKLNLTNAAGVFIIFLGVLSYKVLFHFQKQQLMDSGMEAVPTVEQSNNEAGFADEGDDTWENITGTGEKPFTESSQMELAKYQIS